MHWCSLESIKGFISEEGKDVRLDDMLSSKPYDICIRQEEYPEQLFKEMQGNYSKTFSVCTEGARLEWWMQILKENKRKYVVKVLGEKKVTRF